MQIPSLLNITFEAYPDLEVKARSISMERMLQLEEQAATLRADAGKGSDARELIEEFTSRLVSWTLEDGDEPHPATHAGYMALPAQFASTILFGWFDAMTGDDAGPLDRKSNAGVQSEVPSFLTEAL